MAPVWLWEDAMLVYHGDVGGRMTEGGKLSERAYMLHRGGWNGCHGRNIFTRNDLDSQGGIVTDANKGLYEEALKGDRG